MDDPEEEWEVEDYSTSVGGGGGGFKTSKVSWILSKGLQVGKTILITGVVISSAPVILPPLVVVSAVGLAVSFPAGVVFASYACSERLMNKLLPMPAPPPLLEDETELNYDAEEEEESEFGGEFVWDEELEKQKKDSKEEVEMRIELPKDEQEGTVMSGSGLKAIEEVDGEKLYKDESLKEKGYEEAVGEYLEGEDEGSLGGKEIKNEGAEKVGEKPLVQENKNEKPSPEIKRVVVVTGTEKKSVSDVAKEDKVILVARGTRSETKNVEMVNKNEEDKASKEGTTSLLEKINEEGDSKSVKKNKKKSKLHGKKLHGENKEVNHGKATKEMDVKLNRQSGEKEEKTTADAKRGSTKAMHKGSSAEKVDVEDRSSVVASHQPISDKGTLTNGNHAAENREAVEVEPKPASVTQGSRVDSNVSDEKEVNVIEASPEMSGTAVVWTPEKGAKQENADAVENRVQVFPTSKEETPIFSSQISLSEGKIWEQITAMRTVVGYKATPQPSYMEELKALYIFTGIEPPSSFGKLFDLREAEDKLHFLMSIVGVK